MNPRIAIAFVTLLAAAAARADDIYTNFIRQVQVVTNVEWDVQVEQVGQQLSPLSVDPGGARFELWTVRSSPLRDYLLDHKYVGTYVPRAGVRIYSEDPYAVLPRTRADRPFNVEITVDGLLPEDPDAPDAAKWVKVYRHLQSYGEDGDGTDINRDLATLHSYLYLNANGIHTYQFSITLIPGADRAKVRGEERFTVESLEDYQSPPAQIASQFIQIWPVADGTINGVEENDFYRFKPPPFEIALNDLYPASQTWAQVYPGMPALGTQGTIVPGSAIVIADSVPQSRVLRIEEWASVLGEDGHWTLELLTQTPFGLERLDYVTFRIDRTLKVNGSVTTIE